MGDVIRALPQTLPRFGLGLLFLAGFTLIGFFFIAWWLFVFTIRNGIDGTRAMVAFLSRKRHKWRKIMIGGWR